MNRMFRSFGSRNRRFFLWSSIPDDELLQVAAAGRLSDPAVLERQTRRMLADPRADAMVTNVAGQWLMLRQLELQLVKRAIFPVTAKVY